MITSFFYIKIIIQKYSDEDRSTKRKTQKVKGFKVESEQDNYKASSNIDKTVIRKQEPFFELNSRTLI